MEEISKYDSKLIQTRHGKIHYLIFDSENAPLIVVLPGFTIPAEAYIPFCSNVHKYGFSVIIIDYWGRGGSSNPTNINYSLSSQISLVQLLFDHLQITKCHIIGISYGSSVAAGIVSRSIDIVDKLVFVSPLQFTDGMPSPLQKLVLGTPYLGPLILSHASTSMVPELIKNQFQNPTEFTEIIDKISQICIDQFKNKGHASAISKSIASYDESEIEHSFASLSAVNKKMMILVGIEDKLVNYTECKSWYNRWIQNANFVDCDDIGHLMFFEKQTKVVKGIAKFLSS